MGAFCSPPTRRAARWTAWRRTLARPPPRTALAATGNPQTVYAQAQADAAHMRTVGLNVDFAPLVDVYQGGGIDQSRTFGTTVQDVTTYSGAFLDGLQQNGVVGTLKHWPGLGASTGNPDFTLPTVNHTQAQLNAVDFAPFKALLGHQPGMIMVTTVFVPAYDSKNPADALAGRCVDGVLRGQLGYQGVVVSDATDAQGLIKYMQQQGYSNPEPGHRRRQRPRLARRRRPHRAAHRARSPGGRRHGHDQRRPIRPHPQVAARPGSAPHPPPQGADGPPYPPVVRPAAEPAPLVD